MMNRGLVWKRNLLLLFVTSFTVTTINALIPVLTDENIRFAVRLWVNDQAQAENMYGHISEWDTSRVTDMGVLFATGPNFPADTFNDDISMWDTSAVTNMAGMFDEASIFNQDIGGWNVSSVKSMFGMFARALAFNQDLERWDTGSVEDMQSMFVGAKEFNGNVSPWDTSSVQTMKFMFRGALAFNGEINSWDISNVLDLTFMLERTPAFEQQVCFADTNPGVNTTGMFCDSNGGFQTDCATITTELEEASLMGCEETVAPSSSPTSITDPPSVATKPHCAALLATTLSLILSPFLFGVWFE